MGGVVTTVAQGHTVVMGQLPPCPAITTMLRTSACLLGLVLSSGSQQGLQDLLGFGLLGSPDLLSCNCPGEFQGFPGAPAAWRSVSQQVGSGDSWFRAVSRGTRAEPLGDLWRPVPGLLTNRGVLGEAEQGHVSVSAAEPVVEEVRGEVGLG